ncbi:hypothetical protein [Halorubrum halophilum]|uniref:hypothetical protein n=1 Tax=Halorubrum halophilum TaxID=413816 RepID=UPI0009E2A6E1|nr:hypothetical protein [Halorubrum halophilum]
MRFKDRIQRTIRTPQLLGRGLNRLFHRRGGWRNHNTNGIDLFSEDWDNCLLLDACPYDLFQSHNTIPGKLDSRTSRASATVEFLESTVAGRDLRDTVYVTANPLYERKNDRVASEFHRVVKVYDEDGWDSDIRTVLPETMTDRVLSVAENYPHKRLLAHYIQPHYPFLGPTADEHFDQDSLNIWDSIMEGNSDYSDDLLKKAFGETLDAVLPEVERAVDNLTGKTVVSADHGQIIGDRASPIPIKEYGHPRGIYIPELVEVPWLVRDGERREIVAEDSQEVETDSEVAAERLRALGYAE